MQKTKIIGFWHVWLTNHWRDIVERQLKVLSESGLYSECEQIIVGVLGSQNDFVKFESMIKKYPRIFVGAYLNEKERYEFHTLRLLKERADNATEKEYYFYFHTKGVQFSDDKNHIGHEGGNIWRNHMDKWIIGEWKENIKNLDIGYETSGIQVRPARQFKTHYSGNYFWVTSQYAKLLPSVDSLNLKDRFEAEMWIGSNNPIAATLNQQFVDYYQHTRTETEEEMLDLANSYKKLPKTGRNIVHTLCWNLVSEATRAVGSLYELNDVKDFHHIIVDLEFPLRKGNEIPENISEAIQQNSVELKALAEKHGSEYIKIKNVGVSQNWSAIAQHAKIKDGDVLICCDPDEYVQQKGWVKAMGDVIRASENIGVVSLIMDGQRGVLNEQNSKEIVLADHNVIEVYGALMWPLIGIDCGMINKIGGIPMPKDYTRYGYLEGALLSFMQKHNYRWAFLKDYEVVHSDQNNEVPLLRSWKDFIIHHRSEMKEQISFEDFLQQKKSEV